MDRFESAWLIFFPSTPLGVLNCGKFVSSYVSATDFQISEFVFVSANNKIARTSPRDSLLGIHLSIQLKSCSGTTRMTTAMPTHTMTRVTGMYHGNSTYRHCHLKMVSIREFGNHSGISIEVAERTSELIGIFISIFSACVFYTSTVIGDPALASAAAH